MFTVAIYFINQAYGGPEEGGWWYQVGEPVFESWALPCIKHFEDEDNAYEYANALSDSTLLEQVNRNRPPIHSVNSIGRYSVEVVSGYSLEPFPERKPHYE